VSLGRGDFVVKKEVFGRFSSEQCFMARVQHQPPDEP
jgi:hypothetical protein